MARILSQVPNLEPIKIELPLSDEYEETVETEIIQPPKTSANEALPKDKKNLESDQEKMVIDLFEGKYIE